MILTLVLISKGEQLQVEKKNLMNENQITIFYWWGDNNL